MTPLTPLKLLIPSIPGSALGAVAGDGKEEGIAEEETNTGGERPCMSKWSQLKKILTHSQFAVKK